MDNTDSAVAKKTRQNLVRLVYFFTSSETSYVILQSIKTKHGLAFFGEYVCILVKLPDFRLHNMNYKS